MYKSLEIFVLFRNIYLIYKYLYYLEIFILFRNIYVMYKSLEIFMLFRNSDLIREVALTGNLPQTTYLFQCKVSILNDLNNTNIYKCFSLDFTLEMSIFK